MCTHRVNIIDRYTFNIKYKTFLDLIGLNINIDLNVTGIKWVNKKKFHKVVD